MSKQCLIIGCGSHALAVISILECSIENYSIAGLVDTASDHDVNEQKSGYKVITNLNTLLTEYEKYQQFECIVAIGSNIERAEVFEKLKTANFRLPNITSVHAFVDRTAAMGSGNVIAHGAIINANAVLGDNNIINTASIIEHDCVLASHIHIAPKAVICGLVKIRNLVMIGASATIVPDLTVASGVTLGAGAVLTKSIKHADSVYIGVPAKEKIK